MKTEKLYESDAYLFNFDARILSSRYNGETVEVILDRTAFFPEGGGQGSDRGVLGGARVLKVKIAGGEIVHYCDKPPKKGESVTGEVDMSRRLRMMRCHTGEHLTSGVIKKLFGFDNVGFNLSDERVTLDCSGPLTGEDIARLEDEVNARIREDIPVTAYYPAPEELVKMDYRSKIDLTEGVRIVNIEGVDLCACCAPHVKSTGQIGQIFIDEFLSYKGGTRMYLYCGADAVSRARAYRENLLEIARLFSAKPFGAVEAVKKSIAQKEELEKTIEALTKEKLQRIADSTPGESACVITDDLDQRSCVTLCDMLTASREGLCGVFFKKEGGFGGVIAKKSGGMKAMIPEINSELLARGGGTDGMYHGSFGADEKKIREFFAPRS